MGKGKLIKNDNKFILNKNFGGWLVSEEGKDILILISNYLDIRSYFLAKKISEIFISFN